MIEVYGAVQSRARRVLWTLEECGAPYVHHPVSPREANLDDAYGAINPNRKVPAIRDGELVLFESGAICLHIATKHPDAGLLPEVGTADHARVTQWTFWTCAELEQPLWTMGKHRFALPEAHRVAAMHDVALYEWRRPSRVLAAALADGRSFLVGDRMSVADVMVGHTLNWARGFEVPLGDDVLEAYLDRMIARDAFQRTNARIAPAS
ncbi:MAG: glutathione S-transferase family protein [Sandaracinaceae bacterium]